MSFLVQQVSGDLYLKAPGQWVARKEDAHEFADVADAIDYCRQNSIFDVCLVGLSRDGEEDKTRVYPFGRPPGRRNDDGIEARPEP